MSLVYYGLSVITFIHLLIDFINYFYRILNCLTFKDFSARI